MPETTTYPADPVAFGRLYAELHDQFLLSGRPAARRRYLAIHDEAKRRYARPAPSAVVVAEAVCDLGGEPC